MEVKTRKSQDIIFFFQSLLETINLIKKTLSKRTLSLNGEKYLSNKDVCKMLHISIRSLQEYRDTGVISFIQIKGKILYKQSDVLNLLQSNYKEGWRY